MGAKSSIKAIDFTCFLNWLNFGASTSVSQKCRRTRLTGPEMFPNPTAHAATCASLSQLTVVFSGIGIFCVRKWLIRTGLPSKSAVVHLNLEAHAVTIG